MPAGKLGAIAGPVWIRRLAVDVIRRSSIPFGVSVRSLKPYRSARTAKKQPDAAAIREWRRRLRGAFKRYRVDCGRIHPTATELRKNVSKIVRVARHFVESPTSDLADRLLERLELDRNTEATIRRWLEIPGPEWIRCKRELRNLRTTLSLPGESLAAMVIRIARVDPEQLAPESGPWRDPALFRLVSIIAPLWKQVTGRSAGPLSDDWGTDGKQFPFADWLEEMHRQMDVEVPPRERIRDSTRPSGPRRRQKKPPSVKR